MIWLDRGFKLFTLNSLFQPRPTESGPIAMNAHPFAVLCSLTLISQIGFAQPVPDVSVFSGRSECDAEWVSTFGGRPDFSGSVAALAVLDPGLGNSPELYAGGRFFHANGQDARKLAKWDGSAWSPLGDGAEGDVTSLAVFDDGSGPAVYAGGDLRLSEVDPIAGTLKWDGDSWSTIEDDNFSISRVTALAVTSGSTGIQAGLLIGGDLHPDGGRVALWDGTEITLLGDVFNYTPEVFLDYDDGKGSGASPVVGGQFFKIGEVVARNIARWDGTAWVPMGNGLGANVLALTVFDDGEGGGPMLYAGGEFDKRDAEHEHIARWNGESWETVGEGLPWTVTSLVIHDDQSGSGPALFAMTDNRNHNFTDYATAKWDGSNWIPVDLRQDFEIADAVVMRDPETGNEQIVASGELRKLGLDPFWVAGLNNTTWVPLARGLSGPVSALAVFNDGSTESPLLYAGGSFKFADGQSIRGLARWDGSGWVSGGDPSAVRIRQLKVIRDQPDEEPALFAAGTFRGKNNVRNYFYIKKWDGTSWTPYTEELNFFLHDFAAIEPEDRTEGDPYFFAAGKIGTSSDRNAVYQWDKDSWSAVGEEFNRTIDGLHIFDDGSGPAIYAYGSFITIGQEQLSNIVRWDGEAWIDISDDTIRNVYSMCVFDDGTGPALHASCIIRDPGGSRFDAIVKWNGMSWDVVATGTDGMISSISVFDDGAGDAIYAVGGFENINGSRARGIAKWDGKQWHTFDGLFDDAVVAFVGLPGGLGTAPQMIVGGGFDDSRSDDAFIALYVGCPGPNPDLNGDCVVDTADLGLLIQSIGATDSPADVDQDGIVSASDLGILIAAFGESCE